MHIAYTCMQALGRKLELDFPFPVPAKVEHLISTTVVMMICLVFAEVSTRIKTSLIRYAISFQFVGIRSPFAIREKKEEINKTDIR